jgi:hypothetical protein
MRYAFILVALACMISLVACGGSSDTIVSVQISPQQAQGTAPSGAVNFTANGTFKNNESRMLTSQDGLMWSSSSTAVATINSLTGQATCLTAGSAIVTATVPSDLVFGVGGHNSSSTINGTASLQCVVAG